MVLKFLCIYFRFHGFQKLEYIFKEESRVCLAAFYLFSHLIMLFGHFLYINIIFDCTNGFFINLIGRICIFCLKPLFNKSIGTMWANWISFSIFLCQNFIILRRFIHFTFFNIFLFKLLCQLFYVLFLFPIDRLWWWATTLVFFTFCTYFDFHFRGVILFLQLVVR